MLAVSQNWVGPGLPQLQLSCWHQGSEYFSAQTLTTCQLTGIVFFLDLYQLYRRRKLQFEPGQLSVVGEGSWRADAEAGIAEHSCPSQPAPPPTDGWPASGLSVPWCPMKEKIPHQLKTTHTHTHKTHTQNTHTIHLQPCSHEHT